MAVKIPIEDNTTLLNALKTKAQSLPDGGSSGGDVDLSGVTAGASDVLYGKVIVGANGLEVVGTMPNKGAWNSTATSNGSVTIPEGYHNGSGKVTVNVASSSTIPSDGDAAASDVRSGKTFYSGGSKKTGTMSTVTLGTPSIAVSSSGLITAEVTHSSSGYVVSGTKQATKQMSTFTTTSITPKAASTTLATAGKYCPSNLIIQGDSNLIATNIKSGVSIFGVAGSYTGDGGFITGTIEPKDSSDNEKDMAWTDDYIYIYCVPDVSSTIFTPKMIMICLDYSDSHKTETAFGGAYFDFENHTGVLIDCSVYTSSYAYHQYATISVTCGTSSSYECVLTTGFYDSIKGRVGYKIQISRENAWIADPDYKYKFIAVK